MGIYVSNVSPDSLLTGQSVEIALTGAGFEGTVTVVIFGYYIPVFYRSATLVKFVLPYIPYGIYDITVINGDGAIWFCRQALTITDPPGTFPDLGTAGRPMVLPPIIVDSDCSAEINPAASIRETDAAATLFYNPTTGDITATLPPDSSYVPTEPVVSSNTQSSPSSGQVLQTPWGTFTNTGG